MRDIVFAQNFPLDIINYREDAMWSEAFVSNSNDAITKQIFLSKWNSNICNLKRSVKNKYFSSLGYETFRDGDFSDSLGREQKSLVYSTMQPEFDHLDQTDRGALEEGMDVSYWRMGKWKAIYNPKKCDQPEEPLCAHTMKEWIYFLKQTSRETRLFRSQVMSQFPMMLSFV